MKKNRLFLGVIAILAIIGILFIGCDSGSGSSSGGDDTGTGSDVGYTGSGKAKTPTSTTVTVIDTRAGILEIQGLTYNAATGYTINRRGITIPANSKVILDKPLTLPQDLTDPSDPTSFLVTEADIYIPKDSTLVLEDGFRTLGGRTLNIYDGGTLVITESKDTAPVTPSIGWLNIINGILELEVPVTANINIGAVQGKSKSELVIAKPMTVTGDVRIDGALSISDGKKPDGATFTVVGKLTLGHATANNQGTTADLAKSFGKVIVPPTGKLVIEMPARPTTGFVGLPFEFGKGATVEVKSDDSATVKSGMLEIRSRVESERPYIVVGRDQAVLSTDDDYDYYNGNDGKFTAVARYDGDFKLGADTTFTVAPSGTSFSYKLEGTADVVGNVQGKTVAVNDTLDVSLPDFTITAGSKLTADTSAYTGSNPKFLRLIVNASKLTIAGELELINHGTIASGSVTLINMNGTIENKGQVTVPVPDGTATPPYVPVLNKGGIFSGSGVYMVGPNSDSWLELNDEE